jgi:hypothetical protein
MAETDKQRFRDFVARAPEWNSSVEPEPAQALNVHLRCPSGIAIQVQWTGEDGQVFFFQAELPYDVTQQEFGDAGYAGYRVGPNVQRHIAKGVGVYHFFRDHKVTVKSGIVAPMAPGVQFDSPLSVYLNGKGTVQHVLNDQGLTTSPTSPNKDPGAHQAWVCQAAQVHNAFGERRPCTIVKSQGEDCEPKNSSEHSVAVKRSIVSRIQRSVNDTLSRVQRTLKF